jgi:hypothetical protein
VYFWKFWIWLGMAFFAIHVVNGAWTCYNKFCPGDNEQDWVYEYTDEDTGKRMIVIDGKKIPKTEYQKQMGIGPYNPEK